MESWAAETEIDILGKENIFHDPAKDDHKSARDNEPDKTHVKKSTLSSKRSQLVRQYGSTGRGHRSKKRGLLLKPAGSPKSYRMSKLSGESRSKSKPRSQQSDVEDVESEIRTSSRKRGSAVAEDEDFAQWVNNNKKLTTSLYPGNISRKHKNASMMRGGGGAVLNTRSSGHLRNNFISKKRGKGYRSKERNKPAPSPSSKRHSSNTSTNSKSDKWNNRIQRGIPEYDSKKDKHCRMRKKRTNSNKRVRSKKRNPYTSRYGSSKRRGTNKSTSSKRSTMMSPLARKEVKQAWTEERQVINPVELEQAKKKIEDLTFQLEQSQSESMRVIELKEHTIKQLRLEKYSKDKTLEKLKSKQQDLQYKLSSTQTTLEKREKRLRQVINQGRRTKGSKDDASDPTSLVHTVKKQKAEIKELNGELNIYRTQNKLLRANEAQDRNNREDARDELIKLRKRIRIEQERARKLKEKLSSNDRSSTRVEKLTRYLDREKKDNLKAQERFKKLEVQYQAIRAELADANARLTTLTGDHSNANSRLSSLQEKLDAQKAKSEQLEADKKSLRDQILKLERSSDSDAKATSSLNRMVAEKEEDIKRVARRVTQLEKEKSDWETRYQAQAEKLAQIKTSHKELQQQLETLKQINKNKIVNQKDSDKKERDALARKLERNFDQKLLEASKQHTAQITKLEDKHSKEISEINIHHETTISSLNKKLASLSVENKNLKEQVSDESATLMLKKQVEDLQKKLKDSTERCSVLSESNALLLMRLKREEAKV